MGITGPGDALMLDPDWRPEERLCFYCGDEVWNMGRFVYWRGHPDKYIVLHWDCADKFAKRLIADGKAAMVELFK